jgi:hypothetical protein
VRPRRVRRRSSRWLDLHRVPTVDLACTIIFTLQNLQTVSDPFLTRSDTIRASSSASIHISSPNSLHLSKLPNFSSFLTRAITPVLSRNAPQGGRAGPESAQCVLDEARPCCLRLASGAAPGGKTTHSGQIHVEHPGPARPWK